MSHVTICLIPSAVTGEAPKAWRVKKSELNQFRQACRLCGLEEKVGQKTMRWVGRWYNDFGTDEAAYHNGIPVKDYGKADYVFGMPDKPAAHELGLYDPADGTNELIPYFDYVGDSGLHQKIGRGLEKLYKAFQTAAKLEELGVSLEGEVGLLTEDSLNATLQALEAGAAEGFSFGPVTVMSDGTIVYEAEKAEQTLTSKLF